MDDGVACKNKKDGHKIIMTKNEAIKLVEKMSDEKRAFLMIGIYAKSWQVNLNNVLRGLNKGKPGIIKKGLKELKILNKKIEEMIEETI